MTKVDELLVECRWDAEPEISRDRILLPVRAAAIDDGTLTHLPLFATSGAASQLVSVTTSGKS